MADDTITYTNGMRNETITVPLGKDSALRREEKDIIIKRAISPVLPIGVAIRIKADGTWQWWYTEVGHGNWHWHFANITTEDGLPRHDCTDGQKQTIQSIFDHSLNIFGMFGNVGMPVVQWALGERLANISAAYHS